MQEEGSTERIMKNALDIVGMVWSPSLPYSLKLIAANCNIVRYAKFATK